MTNKTLNLTDHKQRVAAVYDLASSGYDKPAVRFFPLVAERLVELARFQPGAVVLDAGTGTGAAAIAAASKVGPTGRVIGVDIAADMLAQAKDKVDTRHLVNVTLQYGDIEHLEFEDGHFDNVVCASAIFFMSDMLAALKEWRRVLRPGGCVAFSGYGEQAFQPISDLFQARIAAYGVKLAAPKPFSWQRLTNPEDCFGLLREAGFERVDVRVEQLGYYLNSVDEWWDIVWNSGFRGPVSQLVPDQLPEFKAEHLAEVSSLATGKGIWLDVPAIFAVGMKLGLEHGSSAPI